VTRRDCTGRLNRRSITVMAPVVVLASLLTSGMSTGVGAAALPDAPLNLVAQVTGSTVVLNWIAASGGPVTYIVEAGFAPGLANAARISTGGLATSFVAINVPNGTYFVRVRAANDSGEGPTSNEVVVVVGACAVPLPPIGLTASVLGATVTLGWVAGVSAQSFVVEAGSATGLANLFNANIGKPAGNAFVAIAPPGVYYVRVRAVNACGVSGPSNEIIVVVGGSGTTTIGFTGLGAGAFTSAFDSGFTITAEGAAWTVLTTYGNPAPFIQFLNQGGQPPLNGTVTVTAGGAPFRFESVDVYSSVTPIPYTFVGYLGSTEVFNATGTVPNTFGRFATVSNPSAATLIDTLVITLTNPQLACCSNPMGLDNIVLSQ
jgi:hypothetical protein